jgi:cation:H+ antiporter
VRAEYEQEFGPREGAGGLWKNIGLVVVGVAALVLGSKWLVNGAVAIAQALGVSELVIGLTIVAAGTSLPEVATSVVAALRGERDIAVGNVVGSNIFHILCVLGISSLASPKGLEVPQAAQAFDIPVMIGVAVACLPVFFAGYRISRANGIAFLGFYTAYVLHLIFTATNHEALGTFRMAMLWFVLPLTALTLLVLGIRALRKRPAAG